ncbi:1,4-dihydroxy-2-naphthoyl-CoA hydrolase in menaquinone biosynthesis, partial [uncultured Rubrobacteraceae bacterium]
WPSGRRSARATSGPSAAASSRRSGCLRTLGAGARCGRYVLRMRKTRRCASHAAPLPWWTPS